MFKKIHISIPIFQFSTFKKYTRSLCKHFERQKQVRTPNNALWQKFLSRNEFLQNKQEGITYIRTSSIPTSIEFKSKLPSPKKKDRLPFQKSHFTHEPRTQKNIESIHEALVSTITRTTNPHTTFTALYVYIYWYIYPISVFCLTMFTNTSYIKKYVNPCFTTQF